MYNSTYDNVRLSRFLPKGLLYSSTNRQYVLYKRQEINWFDYHSYATVVKFLGVIAEERRGDSEVHSKGKTSAGLDIVALSITEVRRARSLIFFSKEVTLR